VNAPARTVLRQQRLDIPDGVSLIEDVQQFRASGFECYCDLLAALRSNRAAVQWLVGPVRD
jgi:hypothetical protein